MECCPENYREVDLVDWASGFFYTTIIYKNGNKRNNILDKINCVGNNSYLVFIVSYICWNAEFLYCGTWTYGDFLLV